MKLRKSNARHILVFTLSFIYIFIAGLLRRIGMVKTDPKTIGFYGHKVNGNLKYFHDYLRDNKPDYQPFFLTLDSKYANTVSRSGNTKMYSLLSIRGIKMLAKAGVLITDHGSHFIFPIMKKTDLKFVDVWHGIPFKGFTKDSFGEQKKYDQVWVSSTKFVQVYTETYGFPNQIVATGYGRTDPLIDKSMSKDDLLKKYGISKKFEHIVLFAPTWKQDSQNRSIIPFGETSEKFFKDLERLGAATNSLIIFRAHINTDENNSLLKSKHIRLMSYKDYPLAEEFLYLADALVSDWSSIVFDYMVLDRLTVFLNVEPPFKDGFTLDESYRFGPVVQSIEELSDSIIKYLEDNNRYTKDFRTQISRTKEVAYGSFADGASNERYFRQLEKILDGKK